MHFNDELNKMKNIYLGMIFLCILISPGLAENNITWQGEPPRIEEIYDFATTDYLRSIGEEASDAIRLNTLGLNAYKQNNLLKAAKLWRCAVLKKDNYHWAIITMPVRWRFSRNLSVLILQNMKMITNMQAEMI